MLYSAGHIDKLSIAVWLASGYQSFLAACQSASTRSSATYSSKAKCSFGSSSVTSGIRNIKKKSNFNFYDFSFMSYKPLSLS